MADTEPQVWIPSRVWFEFLWRRLSTLVKMQKALYEREPAPENYGVVSGLIAYLMQSVIFTPLIIRSYVRESLALLRFKSNMDRHGMFFLHELDVKQDPCLPEILPMDDVEVCRILGTKLRKRRNRPFTREDEDDEIQFPIGRTPTWKEVKHTLKEQPWVLLERYQMPAELEGYDLAPQGSPEHDAMRLFKLFTSHIWVTLNGTRQAEDVLLTPQSLRESLECWSLEFGWARLENCRVIPCNAGLKGAIPGKRDLAFTDRRAVYFPDQDVELRDTWALLAEEPGYIWQYREMVQERDSEEDVESLQDCLGIILSYCQCLPNSYRTPNGSGKPWKEAGEEVEMVSNPRYYKLEAIGNVSNPKAKARRGPLHRGKHETRSKLLEMEGYAAPEVERARKLQTRLRRMIEKRRSGQAKNKRVPPRRKMKQAEEDNEEENENLDSNNGDQDSELEEEEEEEEEEEDKSEEDELDQSDED